MLYSKIIKEALAAARKGDNVDLSEITVPWGGGRIAKAEGDDASTSRRRSVIWSDKSVDEDNDTIEPSGWNLDRFLRAGGPVLWAHNNRVLPLGKQANTRVDGAGPTGRLLGDVDFTAAYEWADLVLALVDEGVLTQVSVGFRPIKWLYNEERGGLDFLEQRLLEGSVVPVGSNPNTMIGAAQAKGLDMAPMVEWLEQCLDDDDIYTASPREELEVFHKALSPWRKTKGGVVVPVTTPDAAAIKAAADSLDRPHVQATIKELNEKTIDDAKTMLGLVVESVKSGELPADIFDAPLAELGITAEVRGAISWDDAHPHGTPRAPKDAEWIACTGDYGISDRGRAHKDGLCHHRDNVGGHIVWLGLVKAMDELFAREVPEPDRRVAYDHLARHYRDDFDEEPPVFRGVGDPEAASVEDVQKRVLEMTEALLAEVAQREAEIWREVKERTEKAANDLVTELLRESGRLPA